MDIVDIVVTSDGTAGISNVNRKMVSEILALIEEFSFDQISWQRQRTLLRSTAYRIDCQSCYRRNDKQFANLAIQTNGRHSRTVASLQVQIGPEFGCRNIRANFERALLTGDKLRMQQRAWNSVQIGVERHACEANNFYDEYDVDHETVIALPLDKEALETVFVCLIHRLGHFV